MATLISAALLRQRALALNGTRFVRSLGILSRSAPLPATTNCAATRSIFTRSRSLLAAASSSEPSKDQKAQALQDSMFREQIQGMLLKKAYCLGDFVREMRATLDAAKAQAGVAERVTMWFKGEPEELKELEASIKVLEGTSAEERLVTDAHWFTHTRKQAFLKRIAAADAADAASQEKLTEKFNVLLQQFTGFQRIHQFVHWRSSRFLPVPQTREQMEKMMREQPMAGAAQRATAGRGGSKRRF